MKRRIIIIYFLWNKDCKILGNLYKKRWIQQQYFTAISARPHCVFLSAGVVPLMVFCFYSSSELNKPETKQNSAKTIVVNLGVKHDIMKNSFAQLPHETKTSHDWLTKVSWCSPETAETCFPYGTCLGFGGFFRF